MLKVEKNKGVLIGGDTTEELSKEFSALTCLFIASLVADGDYMPEDAEAEVRVAFRRGVEGAKRMIADGAHKKCIIERKYENRVEEKVPEFLKKIISAAKDAGAEVEVVVVKGDKDESGHTDGSLN